MRLRTVANILFWSSRARRELAGPIASPKSRKGEISVWQRASRMVQILSRSVALIVTIVLTITPAVVWAASAPSDIHAAVRTGDLEQIQAALRSGASMNAPDSWGRTPLIVALQLGKASVVEMLINQGANVALTDAWGRTPLLVATQLKNTAAIRLLLDRKADVNAANKNDITPLISAAQTGNREAAAMLLAAGAEVDRKDNLGWTAMMWAELRKDEPMVKLLQEKGVGARASSAVTPKPASITATQKLSPAIDASRIVRGNPSAAITIFEYTDFQCPYCGAGAKTVDEVMARYEGQVRLIVKHLPLPLLHPMAMSCALYFEAISMQSADKAWVFYDRIFRDQRALGGGEPYLQKVAAALGVDMKRLEHDLRSQTTQDRIAADLKESEQYKFDGVPAFVVNGQVIEGAQPPQQFFELIDTAQRQ